MSEERQDIAEEKISDEISDASEEIVVSESETQVAESVKEPSAECAAETPDSEPEKSESAEPEPKEPVQEERIRISVAITDSEGRRLATREEADGEVYVVCSRTKREEAEKEREETKLSERSKKAIGFLCFFSIMFIALAVLLDVIFSKAVPDIEYVGTIFSSIAQALAYLFLAIYGFKWIRVPGRKLGWKIAYWIGIAVVFVSLVVGTTLAFEELFSR